MKNRILCFILAFIMAAAFPFCVSAADNVPGIINVTWSASPGDAIGIYGGNFGKNAAEVSVFILPLSTYTQISSGEMYRLPIHSLTDDIIQSEIPLNIPKDNYAVFVKRNNEISKPCFINTPGVDWIAEREICQKQSVRVFGRNFLNPKNAAASGTRVYVCETDSDLVIPAVVKNVTAYTLDFVVPAGVTAGKKYIIKVNNGASDYGTGTLPPDEAVLCMENDNFDAFTKEFDIELAWSGEFKTDKIFDIKSFGAIGDGVSNDLPALNQAMRSVSESGGGVIYFPRGKYNLNSIPDNSFKMPDRCIFMGDGKDESLLYLSKRINTSDTYGGMYKIGMRSENIRPASDIERRISGYTGGILYPNGNNVHFFAKEFSLISLDGSSVVSYSNQHVVIEDSHIDITHQGPMFHVSDPHSVMKLRFVNNYLRNTQRSMLWIGGHTWVEGNILEGDNCEEKGEKDDKTGRAAAMEHRISEMHGDKIFFGNNQIIGTIGDTRPDYDDNSGEGICNQANYVMALGTTTGFTETTLTDSGMDFDRMKAGEDSVAVHKGKYLIGAKVAIISGRGLGQVRKIVAAKEGTLTIDKPWDVIPESGCTYTIDAAIPEKYLIVGNQVEAATRKGGIMFYNKSYDNIVADNILTNGGGIWFGKAQEKSQARSTIAYFNYVYNNKISGGVPDKPNGMRDNALSIGPGDDGGVETVVDSQITATSQYGNYYKNNTIKGNGRFIESSSTYNKLFVAYNGMVVSTPDKNGSEEPFSKGLILSGNTVTNSVNGVTLSQTSHNTLLYKNKFEDNGVDLNDSDSILTLIIESDKTADLAEVVSEDEKIKSLTPEILLVIPVSDSISENSDEEEGEENIKTFSDIQNHWAKAAIERLAGVKLVNGVTEELFMPDDSITKAEFITLIMRALQASYSDYKFTGLYNDVLREDWYSLTIEKALLAGLLDKNLSPNWNIEPNNPILREEIASVIVRAFDYADIPLDEANEITLTDLDSASGWAEGYVRSAVMSGVFTGDDNGRFLPHNTTTRAEAATLLFRLLVKLSDIRQE